MKKLFVLFVCLFALSTLTYAGDDRPVNVTRLPEKAQQFIKKYFPDVKIALAKEDKGWFDKDYEVIFVNGNKVEFRKDGEMKKVDCKYSVVPAGIVPAQITKYVKENHPGMTIVKFERNSKDYEVKLKGGIELKFDLQFRLKDFDD